MTPQHINDRKLHMLHTLRGRLIVSCQAYPGEPLRDPETMARIAQSAVIGGASAIRAQGLDDIRAIARSITVPQIGLWKVGADGVFITPTLDHAIAVAEAGANIVALDGTRRERPDGRTLQQTIQELKQRADVLVMADAGSVDDAIAAEDAGADIVGTTLAGYTGERLHGRHHPPGHPRPTTAHRRARPGAGQFARQPTRRPALRRRPHPHPNRGESGPRRRRVLRRCGNSNHPSCLDHVLVRRGTRGREHLDHRRPAPALTPFSTCTSTSNGPDRPRTMHLERNFDGQPRHRYWANPSACPHAV
jgi:putative N-acetylmannosamine-6-phosphate epimerase